MNNSKETTVLKLFLMCGGFGWSISIFGIFMPWSFISAQLVDLGASNLPPDPMLNYWLRMTAGAFTLIGLFFFLIAANPKKYFNVVPVAAMFLLVEGAILMGAHFALHLAWLPSVFDSVFCLLIGSGIFLSYYAVKQKIANGM